MELKNLITFVHVAELNSFTKAAQRLGYSQSTISFQIKQLEEELGCLLFERINQSITLTQKGIELLVYAQKINKLTYEFKTHLNNEEDIKGFIHIVVPDSLCESMLINNYQDFYKKYPYISLKFSTADTSEMFEMLNENRSDIMLTLDTHAYHKDYIIHKEEPVQIHFVTTANHPLAYKKNLSIYDLLNESFILTEKEMGYRKVFEEELAKRSIELEPILEIGRTDIIKQLLYQTDAITFLPDFISENDVKEGKLVYLDVVDFEVEISKQLISHKNKWLSKPLETLIDYIIEHEFTTI